MSDPLTVAFSEKNATAQVLLGTHTATITGRLSLDITVTGLNAAAATLTAVSRVTRGGDVYGGDRYSRVKEVATSTCETLPPLFQDVVVGDTVSVYLTSTNGSDTSLAGSIVVRDARAVSDLTPAAQQQISQVIHSQNFVYVAHTGNNVTSGAALKAAIEGAGAGTLVIVGAGTFDLDDDMVIFADGVDLLGSGRASTKIIGDSPSREIDGVMFDETFHLNGSHKLSGFTGIDSTAGKMIGFHASSGDHVVSISDCDLTGYDDALRVDPIGTATLQLVIANSILTGTGSAAIALRGINTNLYAVNSTFNGVQIVCDNGVSAGYQARYVNCQVHAVGDYSTAMWLQSNYVDSTGSGTLHLDGGTIKSTGENTTDIYNEAGGVVNVAGTAHAPTKVSGTINIIDTPGNVTGKVLGGGGSTITGTGVRADDRNGVALATASALAAVAAKTNNLPAQPAATGDAMTLTSGERSTLATTIWSVATSALTIGGSIGKYLVDKLASITGQLSGAYPITVTVTDGTNPVEGADVRVTKGGQTDIATTDVNGRHTFSLDSGTWTVSIRPMGLLTFAAETRTVTGNEAGTLTNDLVMTAISITPSNPGRTTIYGTVYDETATPEADVTLYLRIVSAATTGVVYDSDWAEATSDSNGLVEWPDQFQSTTYEIKRTIDDKEPKKFATGTAPTTPVPFLKGRE